MKTTLLTLLGSLALSVAALAHTGVEIGPNGGRILEFSKDETLHGEVTVKDGQFRIELLDKQMKPVALGEQQLTATTGDREKPKKLAVEKKGKFFLVPAPESGQWVIFQLKESAKARAITARFEYDTSTCEKCKEPEWLCKCAPANGQKK